MCLEKEKALEIFMERSWNYFFFKQTLSAFSAMLLSSGLLPVILPSFQKTRCQFYWVGDWKGPQRRKEFGLIYLGSGDHSSAPIHSQPCRTLWHHFPACQKPAKGTGLWLLASHLGPAVMDQLWLSSSLPSSPLLLLSQLWEHLSLFSQSWG